MDHITLAVPARSRKKEKGIASHAAAPDNDSTGVELVIDEAAETAAP